MNSDQTRKNKYYSEMQEIVNKINSETPDTLKTNAIDEEGKTANVRLAENLKK